MRLDGVDGPRIWLKDETRNPTGSFKDRLHAVSLTMARALGFRKAVASTTGNHGTALAAYAARAGMDALVFCDPRAPVVQRRLMQLFGARVVVLADRAAHVGWLVRERGWYPSTGMTPEPVGTPYGVEGYKTIAYEVFFQLGGRFPERMLVPTSGGDAIYGPWKGFRELRALGAAGRCREWLRSRRRAATRSFAAGARAPRGGRSGPPAGRRGGRRGGDGAAPSRRARAGAGGGPAGAGAATRGASGRRGGGGGAGGPRRRPWRPRSRRRARGARGARGGRAGAEGGGGGAGGRARRGASAAGARRGGRRRRRAGGRRRGGAAREGTGGGDAPTPGSSRSPLVVLVVGLHDDEQVLPDPRSA